MRLKTRLLMAEFVTHDVKRFILHKPKGLRWIPGQGTLVAINAPGLADEVHPFTPTSLNRDHALEYTIKQYPCRHGLTEKLHQLAPGAELLIKAVFGDIRFKGPGTFIAAGAGITPFLAIFRQLRSEGRLAGNSLIFANKTWADIIHERELRDVFGERCLFVLTRERRPGYLYGRINRALLKKHVRNLRGHFYVCGPPQFIMDVRQALIDLGTKPERIVLDEP